MSRHRRQILSEEDYQNNLAQIIQREYYPDWVSLERDVALHERRAAGDFPGAVAVRRAARMLQEHEEQLKQEDQKQECQTTEDGLRQLPRPLHRETLTGFHARATSQDNAEFEHNQSREIQERKQELLAITNGPAAAGKKSIPLSSNISKRRHPMVPSPFPLASDQFNPPAPSSKRPAESNNSLFFVPAQTQQPARLLLGNGNTAADDSLAMPPPTKPTLVAYVPKVRLDKMIEPSATRFPKQQLVVRKPNHLDWDVATDMSGTDDYSTDASAFTDLDAPAQPIHVEQRLARKRKQREQESLVQMTPLIVPGAGRAGVDSNASPIVTWGTVGATPMVLGRHDSAREIAAKSAMDEKSYQMPMESEREVAAQKAQAKLAHRVRRSREAGGYPDARAALLSPAARILLSKSSSSRPPSVRSAHSFASSLRSSYTPVRTATTTTSGRAKKSARLGDTVFNATPRIHDK